MSQPAARNEHVVDVPTLPEERVAVARSSATYYAGSVVTWVKENPRPLSIITTICIIGLIVTLTTVDMSSTDRWITGIVCGSALAITAFVLIRIRRMSHDEVLRYQLGLQHPLVSGWVIKFNQSISKDAHMQPEQECTATFFRDQNGSWYVSFLIAGAPEIYIGGGDQSFKFDGKVQYFVSTMSGIVPYLRGLIAAGRCTTPK